MDIDPYEEANHLPLNQIYLGSGMHKLLQTDDFCKNILMVKDVQFRCRQFLITMCLHLKKRFDLDNKFWWMCSFLSPKKVMDISSRTAMPSLYDLVHVVPRFNKGDIQVLDNEWRHNHDLHNDMDITAFYKKLMDIKDNEGSCKFMFFFFQNLHLVYYLSQLQMQMQKDCPLN